MPGPYTYAGGHPAKNERFGIYGIFERKKCVVDILKIRKYEGCIPKPRDLLSGILRGYRGEKHKSNKLCIADQLRRDKESDQLSMLGSREPFMGSK